MEPWEAPGCVCPWQQVTTKIKYHPSSLAAGGWVCMVLSSSKQETTWPGKSATLEREPLGSGAVF